MNATVVKSSDMDTKCWSALRFLNECHKCTRVESCELPGATQARIKITHQRIDMSRRQIEHERQKIENLLQEAGKEMAG